MKIIKKPVDDVFKSWGIGEIKDAEYRPLKYLLKKEINGDLLLHNVITGELVKLNKREKNAFLKFPRKYSATLKSLVEHHFLVPVDYDERSTVYNLRKILNLFNQPNVITGYTILPTTNCNARCFYCYEADKPHINMSKETADKLIKFMAEHKSDEKPLSISWFGGEPTLSVNLINYISSSLEKLGLEYYSSMISNGYLFDEQMVKDAKEIWKLNNIQITLDGTEEVYNKVKAYVSVKGSAYQRVLKNIELLIKNEIRVSIRMNLDRHNYENLSVLIKELGKRFGKNRYLVAYVYPLFGDCGFDPVKHTDYDRLWLAQKKNELDALIIEHLNYTDGSRGVPRLTRHHCMADLDSSVLVSPDGTFAKCEHCYDDVVGSLDTGITNFEKISWWKETFEHERCKDCELFPSCVNIKGCFDLKECLEDTRLHKLECAYSEIENAYSEK